MDKITRASEVIYARKVVVAMGYDGGGRWNVPDIVREELPETAWSLARDQDIDFPSFKAKQIAIIGYALSLVRTDIESP